MLGRVVLRWAGVGQLEVWVVVGVVPLVASVLVVALARPEVGAVMGCPRGLVLAQGVVFRAGVFVQGEWLD